MYSIGPNTQNQNMFDEEAQNGTKNSKINNAKNKFEYYCGCFGMCIGVVLLIFIAMGYIVWLIFAIKAISNTSNRDIKNECKNSDLWPLMMTIIVVSSCSILGLLLNNNKDDDKSSENTVSACIKSCLQIGLLIWCGIELNASCVKDNLQDEMITILLNYWFYFGCVSSGLLVVMGCCGCVFGMVNK